MRRDGKTFECIAEALGYSDRSGAYRAVITGMKDMGREPVEQLRERQAQRLDEWLDELRTVTKEDVDIDKRCRVVDRLLRIAEREAKLYGLDAPTRVAETKADGSDLSSDDKRVRMESLFASIRDRGGVGGNGKPLAAGVSADASGLGDNGEPRQVETGPSSNGNKRGDNGHPGGSK